MDARKSPELKEENNINGEQPTIDLFALMGGMANTMNGVARDAESDEFKGNMEKDPIGTAFGLLFRMMGGMVDSLEKAAKVEEVKANEQKVDQAKVEQAAEVKAESVTEEKTPSRSASASKLGIYASPVTPRTPDVFRNAEENTSSSPRLK